MSEIATPYDVEIAMREHTPFPKAPNMLLELAALKYKREGYLEGYPAGDAAHSCHDPGCPCYIKGRADEAEEPSVSGRQT